MELVYLWVEDYKNIHKQGFNFSSQFTCNYNEDKNELTIYKNDGYIENFFGENINVTAIVGKNGSGKSHVLDLVIELTSSFSTSLKLFGIILKDEKLILNHLNKGQVSIVGEYKDIHQEKIDRPTPNEQSSKGYGFVDVQNLNLSYINFSPMLPNLDNKYNSSIYTIYNISVEKQSETFNYNTFYEEIFFDIPRLFENKIVRELFDINAEPYSIYFWFTEYEQYKATENYLQLQDYKIPPESKTKELYEIALSDFNDELKHAMISLKNIINKENRDFHLFYKMTKESDRPTHFSGGELALMFYIKSLAHIESNSILLIDEFEVYLHPGWQKKFLSFLIKYFTYLNKNIQLIMTTHSPFLISDLPKENIIFLKDGVQDKGIEKNQTFGANIHTLLSDSFFMEDGLMGEFAKGKINEITKLYQLTQNKNIQKRLEKLKTKELAQKAFNRRKNRLWQIQKIIGEPFLQRVIKNYLDDLEILFSDDNTLIEKELAEIEKRRAYLEGLKNA